VFKDTNDAPVEKSGRNEMRQSAVIKLSVLATALAIIVLVPASASAGVSFTDPSGDSGTAPDITAVTVADNPSIGGATLSVTTATELQSVDDEIVVWIDSDQKPSTGDNGFEYYLQAYHDTPTSVAWDVEHWDGTAWKETPQSTTETFSRSGNLFTWTFSQADLGGSTGFNFYVHADNNAPGSVAAHDDAPDDGIWSYVFKDVQAPTAHAYASRGSVGKQMRLHFSVHDNSGHVAVSVVVFKGSREIASKSFSLQKLDGNYWAPYTSAHKGTFRFCVIAKDAAGNKSGASCAAATVA
jgi:hypothetical protein